MLTVLLLLAVAAFICTLLSWVWPPMPVQVPVLLLCIIILLQVLPLGR